MFTGERISGSFIRFENKHLAFFYGSMSTILTGADVYINLALILLPRTSSRTKALVEKVDEAILPTCSTDVAVPSITMRVLFTVLVWTAAILGLSQASYICYGEKGKDLYQFSGEKITVEFPCKFNAIRAQVCGGYKVTITVGNAWNGVRYLVFSTWISVTRVSDGKFWEGRTDLKVAGKYVKDIQCTNTSDQLPYSTKGGDISFEDIFDISIAPDHLSVTITEKKKQAFSYEFGFYQVAGDRQSSSDWKFICNDDSAVLNPYPAQICGDGKLKVVRDRTKSIPLFSDDTETVIYDVFSNPDITQYDQKEPSCQEAQFHLTKTCADDAAKQLAVSYCWPIVGSLGHRNCLSKYTYNIAEIFAACVEWACSGFPKPGADKDKNCNALAEAIDDCRRFPGLKEKIDESKCYTGLRWVQAEREDDCPS